MYHKAISCIVMFSVLFGQVPFVPKVQAQKLQEVSLLEESSSILSTTQAFDSVQNFDWSQKIILPEDADQYIQRIESLKKEGKEEGKIEGKIEGKVEVATRLLLKFPEWPDILVSEITGLPVEKVKEIRQKPANGQNGRPANGE